MIKQANWITSPKEMGDICPVFRKNFKLQKTVLNAKIYISALGVYEAKLNGKRIGDYVLAPGWTSYGHRVQYQEYDITNLLGKENSLEITIGKGWCFSELTWENKVFSPYPVPAAICAMKISYNDGTDEIILSDESFEVSESAVLYSDIYDGEIYDSRSVKRHWEPAAVRQDYPKEILILQQGEYIREIEEIKPVELLLTEKNEKIIDFGQNLTGYVKFKTGHPAGTVLEISHAEVLDSDGCFYTENLRSAKQHIRYVANGQRAEYKPFFTFQGFRYIRLDQWPGDVSLDDFTAVVVHSDMKRTGYFECSNEKVNKLFSNIIWGQKGNFLDVPTDCPQRDERLGWTGDAQVFIRAASYNFDTQKFFEKWLTDLSLDQLEDGGVPAIVPNVFGEWEANSSSAWGDAAVICPWQIYLTYADKDMLNRQFDSMKKWVDYIRKQGKDEFLWNTGHQYGDWLGLDAAEGSYEGATPKDLIATAYFAYSTGLFIKAGKVLDKDMAEYETLYSNVVSAFQNNFIKDGKITAHTQTAHALAIYFDLCGRWKAEIVRELAEIVIANGNKLKTGFVGTPYLLHALSQNGYTKTAYSLLLQEDFPSWLYSVNKGATTIWEHWDGIKNDGSFWDPAMNSFNHYAYGAVADWMYEVIAGINIDESAPGFENVVLKPIPDKRLGYAAASIDTRLGKLSSKWSILDDKIKYEFEVPNKATIIIGNEVHKVAKGQYVFTVS